MCPKNNTRLACYYSNQAYLMGNPVHAYTYMAMTHHLLYHPGDDEPITLAELLHDPELVPVQQHRLKVPPNLKKGR